MTEQLTQQRE